MYQEYYQEYCNEVHKILGSYFLWGLLENRAVIDDDLLVVLNKTPLCWMFFRYSLQVNFFVSLGRIFDVDGDSFSVDDVLKCCINEIDVFNLSQLKARNESINIESVYQPTEQDFKKLRGEVSKRRKIFEAIYRPIRNKIFAHNDKG